MWVLSPLESESPWAAPYPPLGILHLLANFVTQDLIPVDLSACDRQLATQGLKGGVRHGLVVLTDCSLKALRWRENKYQPNYLNITTF